MPYTLTYTCTYTNMHPQSHTVHTHTLLIAHSLAMTHTHTHTQILTRLLILCERLTTTLPMVRSARSSPKSTLKYAMGENQWSVDIARLNVVHGSFY